MPPAIRLSDLQPLETLRVRVREAYNGTITEPGPLVSDGKVMFAWDRVPDEQRRLAEDLSERRRPDGRRVSQAEALQVFEALGRRGLAKAQVVGQLEKPLWINASNLDRVALVRYGRASAPSYVLLDAYRLLLLRRLTGSDEIRCEGPSQRVVLCRKGTPVAGMTALPVVPSIEP